MPRCLGNTEIAVKWNRAVELAPTHVSVCHPSHLQQQSSVRGALTKALLCTRAKADRKYGHNHASPHANACCFDFVAPTYVLFLQLLIFLAQHLPVLRLVAPELQTTNITHIIVQPKKTVGPAFCCQPGMHEQQSASCYSPP